MVFFRILVIFWSVSCGFVFGWFERVVFLNEDFRYEWGMGIFLNNVFLSEFIVVQEIIIFFSVY